MYTIMQTEKGGTQLLKALQLFCLNKGTLHFKVNRQKYKQIREMERQGEIMIERERE